MQFVAAHFSSRSQKIFSVDDLCRPTTLARFIVCRAASESVFSLPAGVISLWWAPSGQAKALHGEIATSFDRRSIFVSDAQRPVDLITSANGALLGFIATTAHWHELLQAWESGAGKNAFVFPALHTATSDVCRLLVRAFRASDHSDCKSLNDTRGALSLVEAIHLLQKSFESFIERCPGRSIQQKRMVFLRLQRVRNHLLANTHKALTIKQLAASANYSVWRFIRIYRNVFGETPYAAISRYRIEQAHQLLRADDGCIGDVASSVGFESRSALTRALKKRFGINATQLRTASRKQQKSLLDSGAPSVRTAQLRKRGTLQ